MNKFICFSVAIILFVSSFALSASAADLDGDSVKFSPADSFPAFVCDDFSLAEYADVYNLLGRRYSYAAFDLNNYYCVTMSHSYSSDMTRWYPFSDYTAMIWNTDWISYGIYPICVNGRPVAFPLSLLSGWSLGQVPEVNMQYGFAVDWTGSFNADIKVYGGFLYLDVVGQYIGAEMHEIEFSPGAGGYIDFYTDLTFSVAPVAESYYFVPFYIVDFTNIGIGTWGEGSFLKLFVETITSGAGFQADFVLQSSFSLDGIPDTPAFTPPPNISDYQNGQNALLNGIINNMKGSEDTIQGAADAFVSLATSILGLSALVNIVSVLPGISQVLSVSLAFGLMIVIFNIVPSIGSSITSRYKEKERSAERERRNK